MRTHVFSVRAKDERVTHFFVAENPSSEAKARERSVRERQSSAMQSNFRPQVSWMRIRDFNVLTMNELTNTKDERIKAIHVPRSDRWVNARKSFVFAYFFFLPWYTMKGQWGVSSRESKAKRASERACCFLNPLGCREKPAS